MCGFDTDSALQVRTRAPRGGSWADLEPEPQEPSGQGFRSQALSIAFSDEASRESSGEIKSSRNQPLSITFSFVPIESLTFIADEPCLEATVPRNRDEGAIGRGTLCV